MDPPDTLAILDHEILDPGSIQNDDDTPSNSDETATTTEVTIKQPFYSSITLEPLMLLHMIGMSASSVVVQNLYLERICRVEVGFNETICSNLEHYKEQETKVETIATTYTTLKSLLETLFPVLFSLFLGPYTDTHGSKYPILFPMFGYFMSALIYLMMTFATDLEPGYLMLASLPVSLSGGMVALILSAFSYIAKITTSKNRSFRVAMLEGSWFLGGPIGLTLGGFIYKNYGFSHVFMMSGSCFVIGFVYGVIFVKEDVQNNEMMIRRNCFVELFNVEAVKDIFQCVIKRRDGKVRGWMHLMLFTISLRIFAWVGYLSLMYLYTRNKLRWGLKEYTEYSIADSFIGISGSYAMIMITMKILKLNDALIGIIGCVGSIAGNVIFAFALKSWHVYMGSLLSMFAGLISIVIRSMLSKIVSKEEVAKVYTFLACSEASVPLIAVPIYNQIFKGTLGYFPGAVWLMSSGVYLMVGGCFLYLFFSMSRGREEWRDEDEEDDDDRAVVA